MSNFKLQIPTEEEAMESLIKYFGGLENAFNILSQMNRIGYSRKYWYSEGKLMISVGDLGIAPRDLESAIQHELAKRVQSQQKDKHVKYVDAETYPDVFHEGVRLDGLTPFHKSPKLILKCFYHGEYRYVTGYMLKYSYSNKCVYHLDGHNGDWHNTVKGWAYC